MSEFDSLVEGYPGLDDPANDPGPLTAEESKKLAEVFETDEPPVDPDDWPEEEEQVVLEGGTYAGIPVVSDPSLPEGTVELRELRALKPDQVPLPGTHYVIYDGKPMPVLRGNYAISEDEHVRTQMGGMDDLKDADGNRRQRADRTIRMRYRGYLCGQINGL